MTADRPSARPARIRRADTADRAALVELWLRSVRATHDFLSEADVAALLPDARAYLMSDADLWVACDDGGALVGFMGLADREIGALFIDPHASRRGIGRRFVEHARARGGGLTVAVNEQNAGARRFYEAMGFVVERRSDVDDDGRPYPLLYLRSAAPVR